MNINTINYQYYPYIRDTAMKFSRRYPQVERKLRFRSRQLLKLLSAVAELKNMYRDLEIHSLHLEK